MEEEELGPPVFRVWVPFGNLTETVLSAGQPDSTDPIAPLLLGALPLDVLVDERAQEDGQDGVVPVRAEHDEEAEQTAQQSQRPVVVDL